MFFEQIVKIDECEMREGFGTMVNGEACIQMFPIKISNCRVLREYYSYDDLIEKYGKDFDISDNYKVMDDYDLVEAVMEEYGVEDWEASDIVEHACSPSAEQIHNGDAPKMVSFWMKGGNMYACLQYERASISEIVEGYKDVPRIFI